MVVLFVNMQTQKIEFEFELRGEKVMKDKLANDFRRTFITSYQDGTFKMILEREVDFRYTDPLVKAALGCYILRLKKNCMSIEHQRRALEEQSKDLLPPNIYKFISKLLDRGIKFTMDDYGEEIEKLYAEYYAPQPNSQLPESPAHGSGTWPESPTPSEGGLTDGLNTSVDEEQSVVGNSTGPCNCLFSS